MLPSIRTLVAACTAVATPFLLAPLAAAQNSTADPCGAIYNTGVLIPYSNALACLDSFGPPPPSVRQAILSTTATYLQLYPYHDIVKSSPEPKFPINIDIDAELKNIEARVQSGDIRTDRAFHTAISDLIKNLKDAHTAYSHCYESAFLWVQPWSLVATYPQNGLQANGQRPGSYGTSGKPVIRIHSPVTSNWISRYYVGYQRQFADAFARLLQIDINAYTGWTVLEIDELPAADYVQAFANNTRLGLKDWKSTFNAVLSGVTVFEGNFIIGDSYLARTRSTPAKPTRKYKLQASNGTSIVFDIPYFMHISVSPTVAASAAFAWTNRQQFYDRFCTVAPGYTVPAVGSSSARRTIKSRDSIHETTGEASGGPYSERAFADGPTGFVPLPSGFTSRANPMIIASTITSQATAMNAQIERKLNSFVLSQNTTVPTAVKLGGDNSSVFYIMSDGETGVWAFPSVVPADIRLSDGTRVSTMDNENAINAWLESILTGLAVLQSRKTKRLIIDVSGNGGGFLCIAELLMMVLGPDIVFPTQDMRSSPLLTSLAQAAAVTTNYTMWSAQSRVSLSTSQVYTNADWSNPRNPGPPGVGGTYTQLYTDNVCASFINSVIPQLRGALEIPYYTNPATQIAFVSDGNCGSACSYITRPFQAQKKTKVYVWGGSEDEPKPTKFQFCAFEGGPVETSSDFATDLALIQAPLRQLGIGVATAATQPGDRDSWSYLLQNLTANPLSLQWAIPIGNFYAPTSPNRSVEWTYAPADDVVLMADPTNRVAIWGEVAKRMQGTSTVSNSTGGAAGIRLNAVSMPLVVLCAVVISILLSYA
ncbi:hypothetical protein BJ742DRAFT_766257 [Cladochytrium replicatum]|nr:hypothetical protein BJ742DRAFT_766257 [Cladochytrium replicatum]